MRYTQAKPLIDKLMDIAVLFHGSPSMLRTKLYDAVDEFLPDMDEACMERGCPAFDGCDVVEEPLSIQEQIETQPKENQMIDKEAMEYLTLAAWLRGYASGLNPTLHEAIICRLERASDMLHAVWVERTKEKNT